MSLRLEEGGLGDTTDLPSPVRDVDVVLPRTKGQGQHGPVVTLKEEGEVRNGDGADNAALSHQPLSSLLQK